LDSGTAVLVQRKLLNMVQHNCFESNRTGPWCPAAGTRVAVAVSTPCTGATGNLLWWTMMTVGLALFSCFCLAVLVRFGYHRCTHRGRASRRADRLAHLLEQMLLEQAGRTIHGTQAEEEMNRQTELRVRAAKMSQRLFRPLDAGGEDACTVCLEPLSEAGPPPPDSSTIAGPGEEINASNEAMVIQFPECGHVFHAPCLLSWLQLKSSCPICRSEWPIPEQTVAEV